MQLRPQTKLEASRVLAAQTDTAFSQNTKRRSLKRIILSCFKVIQASCIISLGFILHLFLSLLVGTGTPKQMTTTVKNLKAQKLSDFMGTNSKTLTIAANNALEYNKFKVDMHESISEDQPIVFIGDNFKELRLTEKSHREILESFHNFRESTEIAGTVEAEEAIEEESELLPTHSEIQPPSAKKPRTKYKTKYHKSPEQEQLSKQKSLAHNLFSYLDCCEQNGMPNRGYVTIMSYRDRYARMPVKGIKITDVRLYNILIHGYAEKENLHMVRELLSILKEDGIQPNQQTFANYLECLGRLSLNPASMTKFHVGTSEELKKLINEAIKDAASHKFTLNSIVDGSILLKDQREVVLHAISLVEPDFKPVYTPPALLYSNHLLSPMNENIKDIDFNPLEHLSESFEGSHIWNSKKGFSRDELQKFAQEQLESEMTGYVTIKSIQKFDAPSPQVLHCRAKVEELEKNWRERIHSSFSRDLNTLRHQENSKSRGTPNLMPYLRALEIDEFASIVLREVRRLAEGSETYSPTVMQLYKGLGSTVQLRYQMEKKKRLGLLQKTGEIYGNYCDVLVAGNTSDNPRQCWQRLVYHKSNEGPSMNYVERSWPEAAKVSIGSFLYNIMIRDLKVDINSLRISKSKNETLAPGFYTLFRNQGKMLREEVKPHPALVKLYRGSQQETLTFEVNQVPMMCPPLPWTTSRNGGYLLAHSHLIRLPQSAHQQVERIDEIPLSELYPSLDSLNQLASIAWTVNKDQLDVIMRVFNAGGNEKLDVPPHPSSLVAPVLEEFNAELTKEQKTEIFRQKMLFQRKQAETYSLWCDALYRLSLANHYRDRVFWLPHNMDFRGRVYPIPPHLNHLGSDLARSLLVFHRKMKLGIDGFTWLKLHCINLTGMKKRDSVRERLLFAEEVMDDILDSADRPLDGRLWWTKSDEPWQTLSACREIAKVLRSGDPENFESDFPIHQDGSCNGLQHYAALGRDAAGAFSVNLVPADVPQDVYSQIAVLVEQARQRDEDNGVEVARVLRSFVRRKVIKQTVMTTVYGVTRYGARLQIAKQLKALDDFPKDFVWSASSYLTTKTFDSLGEIFTSTKEIQDWLTDCARSISTVCGQNVEWVTPLGLPVVQPYNRNEKFQPINKNSRVDAIFPIDTHSKPNIVKQKNAFPPNFIHSLDSSHMMLTSMFCERAGITFISVHDCFWTHACNVPVMNKICREQFVALHSEPILEDLSKFLAKKYRFKEK